MKTKLRRFDFTKGRQHYSFYFDDTRELINHLVDIADGKESNISLIDVFTLVRQLAKLNTKEK